MATKIPAGQRRALKKAVSAAGGWDSQLACRRALGARPPALWSSTWAVARSIEDAAGLDLSALDAGLTSRPGFVAFDDALGETTGRSLPVPEGTVRLDRYDVSFDQCLVQHQEHVDDLVARARRGRLSSRKDSEVPF